MFLKSLTRRTPIITEAAYKHKPPPLEIHPVGLSRFSAFLPTSDNYRTKPDTPANPPTTRACRIRNLQGIERSPAVHDPLLGLSPNGVLDGAKAGCPPKCTQSRQRPRRTRARTIAIPPRGNRRSTESLEPTRVHKKASEQCRTANGGGRGSRNPWAHPLRRKLRRIHSEPLCCHACLIQRTHARDIEVAKDTKERPVKKHFGPDVVVVIKAAAIEAVPAREISVP